MVKRSKKRWLIAGGTILFIILIVIVLFITLSLPKDITNKIDPFSNVEEPHFTHMPIRYSIDLSDEPYNTIIEGDFLNTSIAVYTLGAQKKKGDIRSAFGIIENVTNGLIKFKEVRWDENPDIRVLGITPHEMEELLNKTYNESSSDGILGLGGYSSEDNQIINGTIFYQPTRTRLDEANWFYGRCVEFPEVEVHELLHVFGFAHVNKSFSHIMFPVKIRCKIKGVDEEVVNCLNWIYSNGKIGGCSESNIPPHFFNTTVVLNDFAWRQFPITYSVFKCKNPYKMQTTVKKFEKMLGGKIPFSYQENLTSMINFFCDKPYDTNVFDPDTDYWENSWRPAITSEYFFNENGEIQQANITLFYLEECLEDVRESEFELFALFHAIGLRKKEHMEPYIVSCTPGLALSSITREVIDNLYGFNKTQNSTL